MAATGGVAISRCCARTEGPDRGTRDAPGRATTHRLLQGEPNKTRANIDSASNRQVRTDRWNAPRLLEKHPVPGLPTKPPDRGSTVNSYLQTGGEGRGRGSPLQFRSIAHMPGAGRDARWEDVSDVNQRAEEPFTRKRTPNGWSRAHDVQWSDVRQVSSSRITPCLFRLLSVYWSFNLFQGPPQMGSDHPEPRKRGSWAQDRQRHVETEPWLEKRPSRHPRGLSPSPLDRGGEVAGCQHPSARPPPPPRTARGPAGTGRGQPALHIPFPACPHTTAAGDAQAWRGALGGTSDPRHLQGPSRDAATGAASPWHRCDAHSVPARDVSEEPGCGETCPPARRPRSSFGKNIHKK